jgi:hypothetical protein
MEVRRKIRKIRSLRRLALKQLLRERVVPSELPPAFRSDDKNALREKVESRTQRIWRR